MYGCSDLEYVDSGEVSQAKTIGTYFLAQCRNLKIIDLSPLVNLTEIGNFFLWNCANLTTIDLSVLTSIEKIHGEFLLDCQSLTKINLGTHINADMFLDTGNFCFSCNFIPPETGDQPTFAAWTEGINLIGQNAEEIKAKFPYSEGDTEPYNHWRKWQ